MTKVWCVLAVLLAAGLAGCAGGEEAEAPREPVDVGDGTVVAPDKAVLTGTVFSDAGLTVPGARVFLPGTPFDATTAADGQFRFVNVTAAKQVLRVEADGFRVHESHVEPKAASLLRVNITLLPSEALGGGYRPHIHDYWQGRLEVDILDAPIDITSLRVGSATADESEEANYVSAAVLYANKRFPRYLIPLPDDDPDAPLPLVYPGTKEVRITFTWPDSPPMPPEYAFGYAPANDNDMVELEPQPSGGTWTVEVSPEMTDNGHQQYSLWEFYIIPTNEVTEAPDYRPAVVMEEVHIKITVVKGDDPIPEPPHPTFWSTGDHYWVRTFDNGTTTFAGTGVFGSKTTFRPESGRIVPPGTALLRLEFRWTYDQPTELAPKYDIYYHTASSNAAHDRSLEGWPKATLVEDGEGTRVFEIEVQPGDTDGFYQQKSGWRFAPRAEGYGPDERSPDENMARRMTIQIDAYRDASADVQ